MGFTGQIRTLQKKHNFTIPPEIEKAYIDRELGVVCKNLLDKCEPCEGVAEALEKIQKDGKYGMAIVSSSAMPRVDAGIKKGGVMEYFPEDKKFSAATSLDPPSSKPDPTIYSFACMQLGVKPTEAVAIEDSKSGKLQCPVLELEG